MEAVMSPVVGSGWIAALATRDTTTTCHTTTTTRHMRQAHKMHVMFWVVRENLDSELVGSSHPKKNNAFACFCMSPVLWQFLLHPQSRVDTLFVKDSRLPYGTMRSTSTM